MLTLPNDLSLHFLRQFILIQPIVWESRPRPISPILCNKNLFFFFLRVTMRIPPREILNAIYHWKKQNCSPRSSDNANGEARTEICPEFSLALSTLVKFIKDDKTIREEFVHHASPTSTPTTKPSSLLVRLCQSVSVSPSLSVRFCQSVSVSLPL